MNYLFYYNFEIQYYIVIINYGLHISNNIMTLLRYLAETADSPATLKYIASYTGANTYEFIVMPTN